MLPIFLLLFTMFLFPLCVLFYFAMSFLCPQISGCDLMHPFQSNHVLVPVSLNFTCVPLLCPSDQLASFNFQSNIDLLLQLFSSLCLLRCGNNLLCNDVSHHLGKCDLSCVSFTCCSLFLYTLCTLLCLVVSFECPQIFSHVLAFRFW